MVPGGDDFNGNHHYTATVLCSQRVAHERGELVLRTDHLAVGDYARTVAI